MDFECQIDNLLEMLSLGQKRSSHEPRFFNCLSEAINRHPKKVSKLLD